MGFVYCCRDSKTLINFITCLGKIVNKKIIISLNCSLSNIAVSYVLGSIVVSDKLLGSCDKLMLISKGKNLTN